MRRIENHEDRMRGVVTFELDDGRCVAFDEKAYLRYGLADMLKIIGVEAPTERLPVFQSGHMVGTLPALFDPLAIKSNSWLYDGRPGDIRRDGDRWIADKMLGQGDLDAIDGFARA